MGYTKVSNYDASMFEWSADSSLPMDKLTNYQKLVNTAWVNDLISGKNPETYPGHGYVIIETMSFRGGDNSADYDSGHIPGAIHLNIYALEGGYPVYPYTRPSDGNLLPDDKLQTFIENMGITHDTTVILYSKATGASQPFRAAWALMYAGVEDVRILNDGWKAWTAKGGAVETKTNTPSPVAFGMKVPGHPEYLVSTQGIRAISTDPYYSSLGDIRAWEEYIGQKNTYTHAGFTAKGRIPGGKWIYNTDWYFNGNDGTLRSYTEVQQMWQGKGITPDKRVAFY
jgi:molybdopterin synthase sulfurtransferase